MITVELKEKNTTNYKIIPLLGIKDKIGDLVSLENHLKSIAINQTIPQQITCIASHGDMLVLCHANGSVNFIDYSQKTEKTINNVIETVRFIRASFYLSFSCSI